MKYLYHGSWFGGFNTLEPISYWRDKPEDRVVYLSGSRAYTLFYIWDENLHQRNSKWVTCALKNGVVRYYEQFPNQCKSFYEGVSGYVYGVTQNDTFIRVSESDMWVSKYIVPFEKIEFIENIYDEILRYEQEGKIEIIRFNDLSTEQQDFEINKGVYHIHKNNLILMPDSQEAKFFQRYFVEAWERAHLNQIE